MARRVNTKFVVILSSALVGVVGIFVGIKLYRMFRANNPDIVQAQAEAAEQKGDFVTAAGDYSRVGSLLSQKHRSGGDAAFAHAAELYMKLSRETTSQNDAYKYYQWAMTNYRSALGENPLNQQVNETLLDEEYQNALFEPSLANWQLVSKESDELIKNIDGVKPRLYSAEARINTVRMSKDGVASMSSEDVKAINADLNQALKLDPNSGKAVSLRGLLMSMQASLSARMRGLRPEEARTDPRYLGDLASIQQMLLRYLEHRQNRLLTPGWNWFTNVPLDHVNVDVAVSLAMLSADQYSLTRAPERLDAALMLLEAASASNPDNTNAIDLLGSLYLTTGQYAKAEALYKRMIARTPESPEGYIRLASLYTDIANVSSAIESYTEVTNHVRTGGGREAQRNNEYRLKSLHEIAWLSMEMAGRSTTTEAQKKDYLKRATDATESLRASALNNLTVQGMVDLLDGRMYMIKLDLPHALGSLQAAEGELSSSNNTFVRESYRNTELLLANINESLSQLGSALEQIRKAQAVRSDAQGQMEESRLLTRLGRFDEASVLLGKLLGYQGDDKDGNPKFAMLPYLPSELAERARAMWALARTRQTGDNSTVAVKLLGGDNLQTALLEMSAGNYQDALNDVLTVLDRAGTNSDRDNTTAYQAAISCYVQLKNTDAAKKYAAQALALFPTSTYFQVAKAKLDQPGGLSTPEAQQAVIEAISDPYDKALAQAEFFHGQAILVLQKAGTTPSPADLDKCLGNLDSEIKTLRNIQTSVKDDPTNRDKVNTLLDRMFSVTLMAADVSKEPQKSAYFRAASGLVGEIEKLNYDGTDGKIALGRLEMVEGKNGLTHLAQAVQQRPDYAYAHLVLGQAYLDQANLDKSKRAANMSSALDEFRQVLKLAPNNLTALRLAIPILVVEKGDSSSMKEAQGLVASGLAQSPRDPVFLLYSENLDENITKAIDRRKQLLVLSPDDRQNRYRLARLYVQLKDKDMDDYMDIRSRVKTLENDKAATDLLNGAREAITQAVKIVEEDWKSHADDLAPADFLAQLYVSFYPTDVEAHAAIGLYQKFINSDDKTVRFNALIAEADFFHKLQVPTGAVDKLKAAGDMTQADCQEEAANLLQKAVKLEDATDDLAERHLADMLFENRKYGDAEKVYLTILENHKTPEASDRVDRRVIECELRQGEFAKANTRLTTLLSQHADDVEGLIMRAYGSILQGASQSRAEQSKSLSAAMTDLTQALALNPKSASALVYRAMAQMELGSGKDLDGALKDLTQAKKQDKDSLMAMTMLAELYVRTQRYEDAVREYRDALAAHPSELSVRIEYTDLLMDLSELQATIPSNSTTAFALSLRQVHPMERLLEEADTASKLYNDSHWVLMYARVLDLQGKPNEALRYYEALYNMTIKTTREAPICDAYLASLLKNKSYTKVIEVATDLINYPGFSSFVEQYPQFVSFYLKRAAASRALGKTDEMVKDIDQAIAIGVKAGEKSQNFAPFIAVLDDVASTAAGENSEAMLSPDLVSERLKLRIAANPLETVPKIGLIQMMLIKNDLPGAQEVVDKMAMPSDPDLKFLVLRESALVRMQNKRFEAAQKDFVELQKMSPDNVDVLNNYAFMLASWGKPADAIPLADRARELLETKSNPRQLASGSANVLDTLGWAYLLNSESGGSQINLQKAVEYLQKSTQLQPNSMAYLHLAQALKKQGDERLSESNCMIGAELAATRHEDETLSNLVDMGIPLAEKQGNSKDLDEFKALKANQGKKP